MLPKRVAWAGAVIGMALGVATAARAEVTLQVTAVQGNANLEVDFGNAHSLSSEGMQEPEGVIRQVRLNVSSTGGHQYQVFQRVNGSWTGPGGKEIPMSAVLFSISGTRTSGLNRFPAPAPMSLGEQEIFLSDSAGTAEELLITYLVRLPAGQRAGSYRTTLSYRVVAQ